MASRVPRAAKPGAVDSCQSGLETVKTGIAESHTMTLAIAAEPFSLHLSKYRRTRRAKRGLSFQLLHADVCERRDLSPAHHSVRHGPVAPRSELAFRGAARAPVTQRTPVRSPALRAPVSSEKRVLRCRLLRAKAVEFPFCVKFSSLFQEKRM